VKTLPGGGVGTNCNNNSKTNIHFNQTSTDAVNKNTRGDISLTTKKNTKDNKCCLLY
jgi:hypothetical protein